MRIDVLSPSGPPNGSPFGSNAHRTVASSANAPTSVTRVTDRCRSHAFTYTSCVPGPAALDPLSRPKSSDQSVVQKHGIPNRDHAAPRQLFARTTRSVEIMTPSRPRLRPRPARVASRVTRHFGEDRDSAAVIGPGVRASCPDLAASAAPLAVGKATKNASPWCRSRLRLPRANGGPTAVDRRSGRPRLAPAGMTRRRLGV